MQEKVIIYLEQLDLAEIEAKLYVVLLETGPISVRDLAEKTNIKRTTAYFYIDLLVEKGLVIKLVQSSQKQVQAIPADECLPPLIEKKLQMAKHVESEFDSVLKLIQTTYPQHVEQDTAEIKYYKGKTGIKKIYEDALKAKTLRSYVSIEEIMRNLPENIQLFDNAFKQNPSMKMYEIVEDSPQAKERFAVSAKSKQYFYKFLPKESKVMAQDILIYDGKVAMIEFKHKISGVVLSNRHLYNNFKILFDYIWKTL